MQGPETRLRKKIIKKLEEAYPNGYFRKIHGNQFQPACVDLLCCVHGVFIAMEVKVKGNKATPRQLHELELVRKAEGFSDVIYSVEEALTLIKKALRSR